MLTKYCFIALFSLALILNIRSQAQNSNCPPGDPLQWTWIQNLIEQDAGCAVGLIQQFEYNGDTYISASPGTTLNGQPCPSDHVFSRYTCQGDFICSFGAVNGIGCEPEFENASRVGTTIWTYEDNPQGNCNSYTGTFFYADCGGIDYYFIELEDGRIFDPYIANDPAYYPEEGQQIQFDFELKTDVSTPCDISESPITITCFEEIEQTTDCPSGDPLQWDWIQGIISRANGCEINEIRQFSYDGSTYFYTVYDRSGFYCNPNIGPDYSDYYIDCAGNFICMIGFGPPCDSPVVNGNNNYTSIWKYSSPCFASFCAEGSPLQWDWIQNLLDNEECAVHSIWQFQHDGNTFFKTKYTCGSSPQFGYYDCEGNRIYESGGRTPFEMLCSEEVINASNISPTTLWLDSNPSSTSIFQDYPWISSYVDQNNCAGDVISVYDINPYNFILIQNSDESKLFLENGTFYCNVTLNHYCFAAYGLKDKVSHTWICGNNPINGCTDTNAKNYNPDANVDDGSCEYETINSCNTHIGTFFYADCGGINYYFIELLNGRIFDPYFADGIEITPEEGQQIQFDFEIKTNTNTPCNISESTITITCFEERSCPTVNPLQLNWIQQIISNSKGYSVSEIRQFTYEDFTYYYTVYGTTKLIGWNPGISNDHSEYYNDCNGNLICSLGFGPPPSCELPFRQASNNYTTVWYFDDQFSNCAEGNAQQWSWQNLIDENAGCSLGSIQQFEYNEDTYFRTTPLSLFDNFPCAPENSVYYDCDGTKICEGGGLAPFRWCNENFINTANSNATTLWTYEDIPEPTCTLPLDAGTCDEQIQRYYFNKAANVCQPFLYSGCGGNANNYETYTDCVNACNSNVSCPQGNPLEWDWIQDIIANSDGCEIEQIEQFENNGNDYFRVGNGPTCGFQDSFFIRYYDCNGNFICHDGLVPLDFPNSCFPGTFDVNQNRTTIWTYEFVCDLPFDRGSRCDPPSVRYYFDVESGSCKSFNYHGCGGNANNYKTYSQCITACNSVVSCSEEDPLQWDWIQNAINQLDACSLGSIALHEYNDGNSYIVLYPGNGLTATTTPPPPPCLSEYPTYTYDCEGQLLCTFEPVHYPPCAMGDLGELVNTTIIWTREFDCADPFELNIVQQAMDDDCTDAIYAFDYEGESYLYFEKGCGYFDVLYNCETAQNVTLINSVQALVNNDNVIWTNPCAYGLVGSVNYSDECGWVIIGCIDTEYEIKVLPDNFNLVIGQTVEFVYTYFEADLCRPPQPSRVPIEITCIRAMEVNCGCSYFPPTVPVCGVDGNTYYSAAIASCYGVEVDYTGACNFCNIDDPLEEGWIKNMIINSNNGCYTSKIKQFTYNGAVYFQSIAGEPGVNCLADVPIQYYNCFGNLICKTGGVTLIEQWCDADIIAAADSGITIWTYDDTNQMKCPENNITSICAPVNIPPSLSLQNFSTTNDPNYINSMSMQMEEQTEAHKYFNTTTRIYTITDESGNQKTCETKLHIANQFLQMPDVSQPSAVCEEDLWSYIKIGADQYKIYADHNGSKGALMSTCNTPSLICSTADFGVDTKVPGTYNFWASTYFEFPDGSICESEAMIFYVEVQPEPVAGLSIQNKTINIGESIALMDLVTTNKSGYWSGENIIHLITVGGENIAYFSANAARVYKLYYTVKNDYCERSYLLVINVASVGKATLTGQAQKTNHMSFNMYPNPTANKVFIDLPDEAVYQVSLTDISGKVVIHLETKIDKNNIEMEVNGLPKGMYLVKLKNEFISHIEKLIIK